MNTHEEVASTHRYRSFRRDCYSQLASRLPVSVLTSEPLFIGLSSASHLSSSGASSLSEAERLLHSLSYWDSETNRNGVVFTPSTEARHLVTNLQIDFSHPTSILDPACGSGRLLCEVLRSAFHHHAFSTPSAGAQFLKSSLFGIDRDPVAVITARYTLLLCLMQLIPEKEDEHIQLFSKWKGNLICGDFLASRTEDSSRALGSLQPDVLFPVSSFSHIIANPPYGLSRNQQIPKATLQHYKSQFADLLYGKPNKYLLFLIRSLELLAENGRLSFLIPNSWLGIVSAKKVRKYLLENGYIRSIDIFKEKIFSERGVETVFLTLEKARKESFAIRRFYRADDDNEQDTLYLHTKEILSESDEAIVPLYQSEEQAHVAQTITKNSLSLQESELPLRPFIALQVYATGKGKPSQTRETVSSHAFHEETPSSENSLPYLVGKDVDRYSISWSGKHLRYGPWVAEHQPLSRYSGPRILIREVLGKSPNLFIATYTEKTFLYNRSILHILPSEELEDAKTWCLALLALMNSRVASFHLKVHGRKASRALFPKIVNDDLKSFRIPYHFQKNKDQLAEFALSALAGKEQQEAEQFIAKLYGVTGEELR